jgi:predicted DsbA family dithiol-disulfide isomerase
MQEEIKNNEQNKDVLLKKEETISVENTSTKDESSKKLTMPMAVLIAAVLIAIAIIISNGGNGTKSKRLGYGNIAVKDFAAERELKQITKDDHIRGDLNKAKVAVVVFSDYECPFCKAMHPNFDKMSEIYGEEVALVYRHFPLESIHPKARPAAIASECIAELGSNDAFWKFTDGVFNYNGPGNAFDDVNFSKIITDTGVNTDQVSACITSGKYDKFIDESIKEAAAAGAQGTPDMTAVNLKTGEAVHIGADPSLLGQVLAQMIGK